MGYTKCKFSHDVAYLIVDVLCMTDFDVNIDRYLALVLLFSCLIMLDRTINTYVY